MEDQGKKFEENNNIAETKAAETEDRPAEETEAPAAEVKKERPRGERRRRVVKALEKPWVAYTVALCIAVILYFVLSQITGSVANGVRTFFKILSPILIGLGVAYILDPLVRFFEEKLFRKLKKEKARRALGVFLAVVFVLAVFALITALVIPALTESVKTLVSNFDQYAKTAQNFLTRIGLELETDSVLKYIKTASQELLKLLQENFGSVVSTVGNIGGTIVNIGIGIVLAIYFLLDKTNLLRAANRLRKALLSKEKYETHTVFWNRCHHVFIRYIIFTIFDALIIAAANLIFMLILRMPYVPLITLIVGVFNMLPTFGPLVGLIIGVLLLVFDNPMNALWFFVFTVILQALDGNVIKPKLFKESLGLPAVWTLISIIIIGKLFGVIGIFVAIPVMVVLRSVYQESLLPWLQKRRERKDAENGGT